MSDQKPAKEYPLSAAEIASRLELMVPITESAGLTDYQRGYIDALREHSYMLHGVAIVGNKKLITVNYAISEFLAA